MNNLQTILEHRVGKPEGWTHVSSGKLTNGDLSVEFERGKVKFIVSIYDDDCGVSIHASVSREGKAHLVRTADMRSVESILRWPEARWIALAGGRAVHRNELLDVDLQPANLC